MTVSYAAGNTTNKQTRSIQETQTNGY